MDPKSNNERRERPPGPVYLRLLRSRCCWAHLCSQQPHGWDSAAPCELAKTICLKDHWKDNKSNLGCRLRTVCLSLVIMGKEQDLLVAVKSGDLLLAHKLLSKVKCNKTSEYGTNRGRGINGLLFFTKQFSVCCMLWAWECNCFHHEIDSRGGGGFDVDSNPSAVSLR